MAAANVGEDCGCAISSARRSRCCASKPPAPTWRPSRPRVCRGAARADAQTARARRRSPTKNWSASSAPTCIDPAAPNPSVEMMLHAFLPQKFIDHTHATAVLSVIDQPDGEKKCAEIFGGRLAFVPYLMPGFGLAKKAIEVFETSKPSDGLILSKHGIVTFGDTCARSLRAHDRDGTLAEDFIARNRKSVVAARLPARDRAASPQWRRSCAARAARRTKRPKAHGAGWCSNSAAATRIAEFRRRQGLERDQPGRRDDAGPYDPHQELAAGPAGARSRQARRIRRMTRERAHEFAARYRDYFERHNKRAGGIKHELDPLPRVVLVPGLGLFGLGRTKQDAVIAADIAEAWVEGVSRRRSDRHDSNRSPKPTCSIANIGRSNRPSSAARKEPPLAGQIAAVTGAGGAIGAATAKAFAAAGAEVALLDVNRAAAREQANAIGATALPVACDVTDAGLGAAAFETIAENFGGVDIVVSNAGARLAGPHRRSRRGDFAQKLRAEFLRPPARGAGRGENHAGARHRRLPLVQCVEAGGQSGPEFRPLRIAEGGAARLDAPIRARLRRRRHPRQRGQCRPHPLRPADRRT